ncbi:acetyl-CoA sensor PanZ family protein [Billgrantia desiderata]|uniref:Acetyl-CoA sensor PanZ family protein n=1 Tax=Billgrantia desiderata TaxID=52021 RepID=A0AAW4YVL8_9GAMM|nr:acetyl-CoA sensor PanZ family protein [Halomonas desiderata]MCE8014109.1 acetyl-CoA sensor PanZ family protein [Halomonas desiderata]MCE8031199.1 acetyl-CoA sensor PanZ family protein [Halomonas desiderata]MCE8044045.1 acetyl-CoA sensor PanZ family protein [Halomonas desiderata]MCE8048619.1 acetyl-CoA sensor PanZ family protein [Halomonas desiderata]MCE8052688.1 acetyl-CoA sensor PanZ family protein [Halomonas desiderata]
MPVTLHLVDNSVWRSDRQVQLDLQRIYTDAPAERLSVPVDTFIREHLDAGHFFACARFNDRLLGAVAVMTDEQAWWLSELCVRKATRRRGVGSRLLALISDAARSEGRELRASASRLPVADQLLLNRLGYRLHATGDYYELAPPL